MVEQEYAIGLAIGIFPVAILWLFIMEASRKKKSDIEEFIQISKYVRTKQKRKYVRLTYPEEKRPLLKIGEHALEIIDISERGIRVLNDKEVDIDRTIHGTAELLCGKTINIDGEVSWSRNKECSMQINSIPKSILSKEELIVSKT